MLIFVRLIFVATIDYENIFTMKISRFTVPVVTMHHLYSLQYMIRKLILAKYLFLCIVVFQQLHDHQKSHHPSPLLHSDLSQGPVLQVVHGSESGGEEQWTSAITKVTGSGGHGELEGEQNSEGTLRGLAEPLLSQQSEECQAHTAVEMLEPK